MSDERLRRLEQAYRAEPTEANRLAWLAAKQRTQGHEGPPDLAGKRFMVRGFKPKGWPGYLQTTGPVAEIKSRGGIVQQEVDPALDYLVLGGGRQAGKAAARRTAEVMNSTGARIKIIDEAGLYKLMRPDLRGKRFHFAGGFESAPGEGGPAAMVASLGAVADAAVSADLDYLVIGPRRGKGKAAAERKGHELKAKGADLQILDEPTFQDLIRFAPAGVDETYLDLPGFLVRIQRRADAGRYKRACKMLKKSPLKLSVQLSEAEVRGIVPSQSTSDSYVSWITAEGRYFCGQRGYNKQIFECGGLDKAPCKHMLAFVIGAAQLGVLNTNTLHAWLSACFERKPVSEKEATPVIRAALERKGEGWVEHVTQPADFRF